MFTKTVVRRVAIATLLFGVQMVSASSLVMTLPNGQIYRIPINASEPVRVSPFGTGDVHVPVTIAAGVAGDGFCPPASRSASTFAPAATLDASLVLVTLAGGGVYALPVASQAVKIDPLTGDIVFHTSLAAGVPGDGFCPGSGGGPAAPVFTTSLTATPTEISIGAQVTLTWATTGATSCTGSVTRDGSTITLSGWSGTRPTSSAGFSPLSIATAGTYAFSISCANAAGTRTSTAPAVVVGGGTSSCSAVVPIAGLTRQTTMTNTNFLQGNSELPLGTVATTSWDYFYGQGQPWPTRTANGTLAVKAGKFIALEFRTGSSTIETFGSVEWVPPAANVGMPLVVLSKCAGDFVNLPPTSPASTNGICRNYSGGYGRLVWSLNSLDPLACRLQPNTTYFFNVAYVDYNTWESSCSAPEASTGSNPTSCHLFAQPR